MNASILFYVSGHGFGHARRSARIVAALRRRAPHVRVVVRTAAPAWTFTGAGIDAADVRHSQIDAGVAEIDAMTVDPAATVERVMTLLRDADRIVAAEVAAARDVAPSLILADAPWLAAEVAERIGVPCVASGNFTWDFIYEPLLRGDPRGAEALARIRSSYRKMAAMLRQPFAHDVPYFPEVVDVPVVARRAAMDRAEAARRLGLDSTDGRKRVLIGMRGGSADEAVVKAARSSPNLLFTILRPVPAGSPANLRQVEQGSMDFTDVLVAHDAVVTKLGYGTVADCIASQVRILWPRRTGFAEDPLFEADAPRWLPMREIARADYVAGSWGADLAALLAAPPVAQPPRVDGEDVAAAWVLASLRAGKIT